MTLAMPRSIVLQIGLATGLVFALWAAPALAGAPVTGADLELLRAELNELIAEKQLNIDHVWTMIAVALVFLMQVGFLLLEAGFVRSKNSINVAQKNIADFVIAAVFFYLVGFAVMFGPSVGGWFGFGEVAWGQRDDWDYTFFVFQLVFCGTAATIVSGAVAERMKFAGYLIMTVAIALVIYPVFGHWAWGNLLIGDNQAWLADMGFIDFAGSTVVHSVGGWIALAGVIVLGQRIGRFDDRGKPVPIHGHSPVLATAGALLLWIGWIGFNGGSTTAGTPEFAHIISNTMLAGAFASLVTMAIGRYHEGLFRPMWPINGALAGLVGITAGCDAVTTHGAILIGLSSGVIVYYAIQFLEHVLKLDDAVGAVAVHGVCGAWGTVMAGALAMPEKLAAADRLTQVGVQLLGVGIGFVWAFGISYVVFATVHAAIGLRVSRKDELEGLNVAEHGVTLGTGELQKAMIELATGDFDLGNRLDGSTGDESGELAQAFNILMGNLQKMIGGIAGSARRLVAASAELRQVSNELTESSGMMRSRSVTALDSTAQVAKSVDTMARAVGDVDQTIGTVSAGANQISEHISAVTADIGDISKAMEEIASSSHKAASVASDAVQRTADAVGTIKTLDEAGSGIANVLTSIRTIAHQTRILALNATIEAERAGTAGKGFAVVAKEVKRLADDTATATDEIEARVKDINGGVGGAMEAMTDISGVIDNVNQVIDIIAAAADEQFSNAAAISERMVDASARTGSVATAISEVANTANSTSAEARQAADGTRAVHSGVEEVSETASRAGENAAVVRDASEDVARIANELETAVGKLNTAGSTG